MVNFVNGSPAETGALTNTGGTATVASILGDVANSSFATRLGVLQNHLGPSYTNGRYLTVSADMTSATWNTMATQEVFIVTGLCRLRMWIVCTGNIGSAGSGATVCFGHEGDTDMFIADTDETELDSGDLWYDATPTLLCDLTSAVVMDYVSNGLDIGYEIKTEALTGGSLVFHCIWEPLDSTGAVIAGAGAALV
jgi:hypothetical protein